MACTLQKHALVNNQGAKRAKASWTSPLTEQLGFIRPNKNILKNTYQSRDSVIERELVLSEIIWFPGEGWGLLISMHLFPKPTKYDGRTCSQGMQEWVPLSISKNAVCLHNFILAAIAIVSKDKTTCSTSVLFHLPYICTGEQNILFWQLFG